MRVRGSVRSVVVPLLCWGMPLAGCGTASPDPAAHGSAAEPAGWFVEAAADSGLTFRHVNGMSGKRYLAEIMAPGAAVFDYDGDGDLDVYAVQGHHLDARQPGGGTGDRLFRNDLAVRADGTRLLRFTDVTKESGIDQRSYGMGVAAGDYDNDGHVDLYLTRLEADVLLRNRGDGTFTDVTAQAGLRDVSWSVSASFVDVDGDGWLDLFVGNYVRYSIDADVTCRSPAGVPSYCMPQVYQPVPPRLYRNRGDGTFGDVTVTAGVAREYGPTLGVSTADFDGDGRIDIYVANDGTENQLWLNQGGGRFTNAGLLSGAALSADGVAEASMGVDAADFDDDGDEDLVTTNLTGQGITVYVNNGAAAFVDAGTRTGLRPASLGYTGFGAGWIDVDNDGRLDLLTVNGAVQAIPALVAAQDPFPLHQRKQLFRNAGGGRFDDVTDLGGAAFALSEVGRGAAFGDIDNDGDVDVVVANNNGPLRLFVNRVGDRQHWLGLRLVTGSRDAVGARVEVTRTDGTILRRRARADGSYASADDPRVLVGLGASPVVSRVRIFWPSGRVQEWTPPGIDRWLTVEEGRRP